MSTKLIMVLAFALGTGSAALAQTTPAAPKAGAAGAGDAAAFSMPQGWDGAIGASLFSDPAAGTAHSKADISKNWASMSADEQGKVRDYCANLSASAPSTSGNAGTTAGTTPAGTPGTVSGDTAHASVRQICEDIKGL